MKNSNHRLPTKVRRVSIVRRVQSVSASANGERWYLSLECGHGKWITSSVKPQRAMTVCNTCTHLEKIRLLNAGSLSPPSAKGEDG